MSQWIFETGDRDFKEAVIERSKQTPVVVDFWAPWCGPCRVLGPVLERLAERQRGEFSLAKVNVDENPGVASAFHVQSIPLLVGFRDGKVVAEAVGAMPEPEVLAFLQKVLPSAAERKAASAAELLAEGKLDEAEVLVRQTLEDDPRNEAAVLTLAKIEAERANDEEALRLLERNGPGPLRSEADRFAATLRIRADDGGDESVLQARVKGNPDDLDARAELGHTLAARSRYEEALQQYLEVVRRDKEFGDGIARKAMLDIFEILGPESVLADRYRTELATVLFS
jgi:putative thioredoxin